MNINHYYALQGLFSFYATSEEGTKIMAEIDKRRANEGKSAITVWHISPVKLSTFDSFFS